ncbi:hypothetical protein Tco_0794112 [Tanacetum coccineum]
MTPHHEHIHFTAKKIEEQKRIKESLKAKLAKQEVEKVKNELVDLMGIDVLDKLNDLANKKRKRAYNFHDYFKSTKKFKPSIWYKDHPAGSGLNDHVRTLSSFLLLEVDKRNLNPIEQLRERLLGSVFEPFSLSLDLNIKSPKYSQAEDSSALVAEETSASVLQLLRRSRSSLLQSMQRIRN